MDDHPAWSWIIEFAGQTLHMFHINRADGLTPSQRIQGENIHNTTSPNRGESLVQNHEDCETERRHRKAMEVRDLAGRH